MGKKPDQGEKLYFVALVPTEPLCTNLVAFKEYFRDKYSSSGALNSPPHITLHMPFRWKEAREGEIDKPIQKCCKSFSGFPIRFEGFGAFPPRVIFLRPAENETLNTLQKQLARSLRLALNIYNADYKDRGFHPHLTLAFRDLRKNKFEEAWKEFENKPFEAKFYVDSVQLLKHNGSFWEIHKAFPLSN